MDPRSDDPRGPGLLLAIVLLVCCALPFLLLSGASLAFIKPYWPVIGAAIAVAGAIGFVWYVKRGWPRRRPPAQER